MKSREKHVMWDRWRSCYETWGCDLGARDDGCFPILNEELFGTLSNPQNHRVAWDGEGVE